jgi:hypothetical protein
MPTVVTLPRVMKLKKPTNHGEKPLVLIGPNPNIVNELVNFHDQLAKDKAALMEGVKLEQGTAYFRMELNWKVLGEDPQIFIQLQHLLYTKLGVEVNKDGLQLYRKDKQNKMYCLKYLIDLNKL